MKKLILALLIMAGVASVNAQQFTIATTIPAFRTISLFTNYANIYTVSAVNTNLVGTNTFFYLFDSPNTNTYYTNAPYSTITTSNGTFAAIYTNVLGTVWTNTATPALYRITNNITTGLTNFYNMILQAQVGSNNGAFTYYPTTPLRVNRGLIITNGPSAVNIVITYGQ